MNKRTLAELLLVLATVIWGATFVVVKDALNDATPLVFVALRFSLAAALLWLLLVRGHLAVKSLGPGLGLGCFLFAGFIFQTQGLLYTTPSKSAFITGFSVVLVPLIVRLYGVRIRPASAVGALSGLAGLYFLVVPSGVAGVNRGDVFTLIAATAFAIHIVLVGRYAKRHSFVNLVPAQILAVAVLALVALPFAPQRHLHWTGRLALALLVTAVLATGFAFSAQNWAQRYTPAAHTALIFSLEPVFAALTSRVVLGEHFGGRAAIGSLLVLTGMVVSEIWGSPNPTPLEG